MCLVVRERERERVREKEFGHQRKKRQKVVKAGEANSWKPITLE